MDYFTLQFLFVLLAGRLLGPVNGTIAVAVYVAVGLAGVPIFAAGGGISYLFRPSFGYLARLTVRYGVSVSRYTESHCRARISSRRSPAYKPIMTKT